MTSRPDSTRLAEQIAELAGRSGSTVAAAESLTSGLIASYLGAAPSSADWFSGSVVSYMSHVKFHVLGVPEGPVVTAECAQTMAAGVARLLESDLAVAVTGVGGPEEEEGEPPGTVYIATAAGGFYEVTRHDFGGEPPEIIEDTTAYALQQLLQVMQAIEDSREAGAPDVRAPG